jgi:hypothetical protein
LLLLLLLLLASLHCGAASSLKLVLQPGCQTDLFLPVQEAVVLPCWPLLLLALPLLPPPPLLPVGHHQSCWDASQTAAGQEVHPSGCPGSL